VQKKTTQYFRENKMERESILCMWMILWSHEMTQKGMTTWKSTYRSTFKPRILDPWSIS